MILRKSLPTFLVWIVLFGLYNTRCKARNNQNHQEIKIKVRVINDTDHRFTHVSLFSKPFPDLNPKDSTSFISVSYNPLKDDALIYCMKNDKNLGRYLEVPKTKKEEWIYKIDSLRNDILYVSLHLE